MELDDYNCWTIAEAAGHPGPHRMQHLLSRARCDDHLMLDTAALWAAGRLAGSREASDAVLIVDETVDAKSSAAPGHPASTAARSGTSRCARSW